MERDANITRLRQNNLNVSGLIRKRNICNILVFGKKTKKSKLKNLWCRKVNHSVFKRKTICFFNQLMQESPEIRSVGTLEQLIRILNSFHDKCISRDLRSDPGFIRTCGLIWMSYINYLLQ